MKKSEVIKVLNDFPEYFVLEELVEKLLFIEEIEKGLTDSKNGKTMSLGEIRMSFINR